MEDAIALRDELLGMAAGGDVGAALAAYEARRRPEVEALQAAAQASLEWFEGTERYMTMTPIQLTYSLMTRSLRVSHGSVGRRDPYLARGVEQLLAATVGVTADPPLRPTALPCLLGDRRARSRIVVTDPARTGDAGLVVVPVGQARPEDAHARGALIVARIATGPDLDGALARAERCDAVLLDAGDDPSAIEELPMAVQRARERWRGGGWIAAVVHDRPATRSAVVGHAAQLVRAGADLLWVSSAEDADLAGGRLPAAPLADRLRNELAVATAIVIADGSEATLADLDAAIAGGRADLLVVSQLPT
jgi:hypothetical protein